MPSNTSLERTREEIKCQAHTTARAALSSTVRRNLHMVPIASDKPPTEIDGATVLKTARVGHLHAAHTGNTRQVVADELMGPASHLAIAQYQTEAGVYLFYCDQNWVVMADTWHEKVSDAEAQAEFEYAGISAAWDRPNAV